MYVALKVTDDIAWPDMWAAADLWVVADLKALDELRDFYAPHLKKIAGVVPEYSWVDLEVFSDVGKVYEAIVSDIPAQGRWHSIADETLLLLEDEYTLIRCFDLCSEEALPILNPNGVKFRILQDGITEAYGGYVDPLAVLKWDAELERGELMVWEV